MNNRQRTTGNYLRRCFQFLFAAASTLILFVAPGPQNIAAQNSSAQNQLSKTKIASPHEPPPYWAFVVNPPVSASDAKAKPADTTLLHVPDSEATFTVAQTQDFFKPPDWHPSDHPTMPDVVSVGRAPDVFACGYCHLPNGQGRPENASLAGLPAHYIVRQLADFKRGLRKSSEPKHGPTTAMIAVGTKANDKEGKAAAAYFSQLKPKPWIRVVETDTVPKTHVAGWMLIATKGSADNNNEEMEPIGERIIETPENLERTELRDDHSGFIAYVPVGSIKKGRVLATTGSGGKTSRCANCHGRDLKGNGNIPAIAGRSPSYIVRQLYDIQKGARAGSIAQQMKPIVTGLTIDDMLSIAAYTASLHP
jgi:cytochrome c553